MEQVLKARSPVLVFEPKLSPQCQVSLVQLLEDEGNVKLFSQERATDKFHLSRLCFLQAPKNVKEQFVAVCVRLLSNMKLKYCAHSVGTGAA